MNVSELLKLNDKQLLDYFSENARYHENSPAKYRYSIMFGNMKLFGEETDILWDKFENKVKQERKRRISEELRRSEKNE